MNKVILMGVTLLFTSQICFADCEERCESKAKSMGDRCDSALTKAQNKAMAVTAGGALGGLAASRGGDWRSTMAANQKMNEMFNQSNEELAAATDANKECNEAAREYADSCKERCAPQ